MSTPINHHYVSQCHSRYFFNEIEKLIYCYDKQLDNYYSKSTIKSLFSEDLSNTKFENNKIDNQTLEDQLNEYFEKDFPGHSNNIIELANDPSKNNESKLESLYYIACYALIADVRFPFHKKGIDELYNSLMRETAYKVRLLEMKHKLLLLKNLWKMIKQNIRMWLIILPLQRQGFKKWEI